MTTVPPMRRRFRVLFQFLFAIWIAMVIFAGWMAQTGSLYNAVSGKIAVLKSLRSSALPYFYRPYVF